MILPVPVILNLFAAVLFVLILGIPDPFKTTLATHHPTPPRRSGLARMYGGNVR
jgi:hypothetical protein